MQDVQASELVSVRREIEEQSMLPSPRHVLQKGAVVSRSGFIEGCCVVCLCQDLRMNLARATPPSPQHETSWAAPVQTSSGREVAEYSIGPAHLVERA